MSAHGQREDSCSHGYDGGQTARTNASGPKSLHGNDREVRVSGQEAREHTGSVATTTVAQEILHCQHARVYSSKQSCEYVCLGVCVWGGGGGGGGPGGCVLGGGGTLKFTYPFTPSCL